MNSPDTVLAADAHEESDPPLLRKAAGTLAITKASQSITLVGRKIFNVLVWTAQQTPGARQWSIPLAQVAKRIEYGSRNYELLKEACRKMLTTIVEWESPVRDEAPTWRAATLLAGVDLVHQKGQILITWSFAHNLQPELLDPSRFARVRLDSVARLRTVAALELYQICSRYKDNPSHLTSRRPWTWWYEALRLQPGKTGKPPQFKFFRRDTLVPAIAEVNAVTELQIEMVKPTKLGRVIQDLQFEVRVKGESSGQPTPKLVDLSSADAIERAAKLGLADAQTEDLIERFGEPEFVRALQQMEQRGENKELPRVQAPARWIEAVLLKSQPAAHTPDARKTTQGPTPPAQRAALLRLREQRIAEAWAAYQALDYEIKEAYKADFAESVLSRDNAAYLRNWAEQGTAGRLAGPLFRHFLCGKLFGPDWDRPDAQ